MKWVLESEGFRLREFHPDDAPVLYQLNKDPEVIRYTGNVPFQSIAAARTFLENYEDYQKHGFGRWWCVSKIDKEMVGWCGLKRGDGEVDIGFRFFKSHWGRGVATETAKACLSYGFQQLKLDQIVGRASKENKASIRVLEKIGLRYWKDEKREGMGNCEIWKLDNPNE
jgi:ribosomal-protein-alanine N-acetyltransferase